MEASRDGRRSTEQTGCLVMDCCAGAIGFLCCRHGWIQSPVALGQLGADALQV